MDNAIDEALAGYCTHIEVILHKDGSCEVRDNGRGFPVGIHPKLHRPAVEVCLTVLHAGGKFGGEGYKVSGGLHGVGASVVNALSKHLKVTVYQDGKIYQQEYARGKVLYDLKVIGETDRTGTTIQFWPDSRDESNPDGVFETGDFQYNILKARLREMAFLNKGIRITFTDERTDPITERVFYYEGGIIEFVKYLNKNKEVLFEEPIYIEGIIKGTSVEVAFQYNDSYQENIYTFANNIHTPEGGTHLTGFSSRPDPRHQRIWPSIRFSEGGRRESQERGRAGEHRGGHQRKAGGASVRGADQVQTGQQRSAWHCGQSGVRQALHLFG